MPVKKLLSIVTCRFEADISGAETSCGKSLGPVVRKPISLIQDERKLLFQVFNFLVKVSFAYFCFSRLTSGSFSKYQR